MMTVANACNRPMEVSSMAARLSLDERVFIESALGAGRSVADAARRLGRDPSTVHRELDRCGERADYDARWAHASACARARRARAPKPARDPVPAAAVNECLRLRWSPHAAAADLRAAGMSVCAQTIHRACHANDPRSGLPAGSWKKLPRRCRRRGHRARRTAEPSPLGQYRPIPDRPADAADRTQPGHREGDLIVGNANRNAAVTLAERTSRYAVTAALPDGYGAPQVAAAVAAALGCRPAGLVRTLTWDQGREMARWADAGAALGIEVFFCEPRSPWQRPTNEHTNGLLRRWLPKGTDLDIRQLRLGVIEDKLNHMPRRLHDWQSAADIYTQLTPNHQ
jgi:IS30 family transposase